MAEFEFEDPFGADLETAPENPFSSEDPFGADAAPSLGASTPKPSPDDEEVLHGLPPTMRAALTKPPVSSPQSFLPRTGKYFRRGVSEVAAAPGEFVEPFQPPAPPKDPLEELELMMGSRLSQKLKPVLKGVFGAFGAVGSPIAAAAEPAVRSAMTGLEQSDIYQGARRMIPKLPANLADRTTEEISYMLGQVAGPPMAGKLARRFGPKTEPTIPTEAPPRREGDIPEGFLEEQARVEKTVAGSEAEQIAARAEQKAILDDLEAAITAEKRVTPTPGVAEPPLATRMEPGEIDATAYAGDVPSYPSPSTTSRQVVRARGTKEEPFALRTKGTRSEGLEAELAGSTRRGMEQTRAEEAAIARGDVEANWPPRQEPTRIPTGQAARGWRAPDESVINAPGAGQTIDAEFTVWPNRNITEMHAGLKPDFKKLGNKIASLPGVQRILDLTEAPRAYAVGAAKAPEYLTQTRGLRGQQGEIAARMSDLGRGIDRAIAETLKDQRWANAFTKKDARTRVALALKGDYSTLPKGSPIEATTKQIREMLNILGKEKQARGLISEEAGANADYLRRLYARDVLGGDEWARIMPEATRTAGVEYILRNDKVRTAEGFRSPTLDEAKSIADSIARTGHSGPLGQKLRTPYKISAGQLKRRKDIPLEIRGLMGEIDDGLYLAARTMHDGANLVVMNDFFKSFSKGGELVKGVKMPWIAESPQMGYRPVKLNDYARQAMGKKPGEPVYIMDKYYRDFDLAFGPSAEGVPMSVFDKIYNPLYSTFKAGKTIFNPATHGRNILGNVIFASGARNSILNPANYPYYRDAFKEILGLKGHEKRELFYEAMRSGSIGGEYAASELKQMADSFYRAKGNWLDFVKDWTVNSKAARGAGKVYTAEDQFFKLASYIKQRKLGMSPEQASLHTNKFFPRYDELSPLVQGLRQGAGSMLGSPFVSFAAEAARIGKNMALESPFQLAAWTLGIPGLSYAGRMYYEGQTGRDTEAEIRKIPPELRSPLGTFFMPFPDEKGNLQFIDTTYWHPLGQFLKGVMTGDTAPNISSMPILSEFVGGNPIMNLVVEVLTNTQLSRFRRGEMVKRPSEGGSAYAKHIAKALVPPLAPYGTAARKIASAATGAPVKFGQRKSLASTLVGEVTPFRVETIDPQMAAFTRSLQKSEARRISEDERRVRNDFRKGKMSPQEFRNAIQNIHEAEYEVERKFRGR